VIDMAINLLLVPILICSCLSPWTMLAQDLDQSLGDIAREQRTRPRQRSSKTYTNHDLSLLSDGAAPMTATISGGYVLPSQEALQEAQNLERALQDDLVTKFQEQKRLVQSLQQNLDSSQREYALMATLYYVDVGNYVRNPDLWKRHVLTLEELIGRAKGQLEAATQTLDDLRERLRRAGIKVPD
jgi:hypothetical protein